MLTLLRVPIIAFLILMNNFTPALAHELSPDEEQAAHEADLYDEGQDDFELLPDYFAQRGCMAASSSQIAIVNSGNKKLADFKEACLAATDSSKWCEQIARPNPSSKSTFYCTYGDNQPHQLVHPDTDTWNNAIKAIQLIQKLSDQGYCVSQIYNWWRPEPYNKNVGGAAGRHPFGTSVDVRFCSNSEAIRAFDKLCSYRKQGELRALGYYGSTGLHLGISDHTANTWGRSCN